MLDSHPSAVACPSPDVLVRFGSGELADAAFETVASHLSRCVACLAVLVDYRARSASDDHKGRLPPERCTTLTHDAWGATVSADGTIAAPAVAPSITPESWIGELVGRFRILGRLGAGGMGVVYLAEDPVVRRPVALKMVSGEGLSRAHRLERFRTEGQALARVRHPNVVQFYHFDEHAGFPYFTMEFVAGASLAKRLADNPLPAREAAELVRTLAIAVHAVHTQGVIHRDIKPSNILIEADGTPKIADFGLAKLADATGNAERTHTGVVLGTPSYMAPEQAEGRVREIDARTDVYALGAVLFAALTGHPPVAGSSIRDTLLLKDGGTIPPARSCPDVPQSLARICEKCLEKSQRRRYATAQALADDLSDWLEGRPPRGLPGPVARILRPSRRQALVAGLGLAAAGAGIVAYRRNPHVIISGIQDDLRAGKAVTLIGENGPPRWSRWVVGEGKGKLDSPRDGVVSLQASDDVALVELLPDPQVDAYRLTVQVRHDQAEIREMSEVGIFIAHRGHRVGATAEAHFFIQFSYNDILTAADRRVFVLPNGQALPQSAAFYANLRPRLHGESGDAAVKLDMAGVSSQPVTPVGEAAGVWRTVDVTVTPAGITCTWDGALASLSVEAIHRSVARAVTTNPVLQGLAPEYTPRGGLGLFASWGTASFRSVIVSPLNSKEDRHA